MLYAFGFQRFGVVLSDLYFIDPNPAQPPGSFDRTHHHPAFRDWEPSSRVFVAELSARPLEWLRARLSDLDGLLDEVGVAHDEVTAADAASLRACVPEIVAATSRLLDRVRAGELATPPSAEPIRGARVGWL